MKESVKLLPRHSGSKACSVVLVFFSMLFLGCSIGTQQVETIATTDVAPEETVDGGGSTDLPVDYHKVLQNAMQDQYLTDQTLISEYRVGTGDVLEVNVWGEEDLSGEYLVRPNRTISFPLLGDVEIRGLTVREISDKIEDLLEKDYLVEAKVKTSVAEYHSQKVYVFGFIKKPGRYELRDDPSLLSLLLRTGGADSSTGRELKIIRRDPGSDLSDEGVTPEKNDFSVLSVDIWRLLYQGDLSQNVQLKDGDILLVSGGSTTSTVVGAQICYILGEVQRPGIFEMTGQFSVLDAVLKAGGFTEFAAPNRTKVIRGEGPNQKIFQIRAGELIANGDMSKNFNLEPGDILLVPESYL